MKNNNKIIFRSTLACASLFGLISLQGCSTLSIGESSFSCNKAPGGIPCASVQDAYSSTHKTMKDTPKSMSEIRSAEEHGSFNPLLKVREKNNKKADEKENDLDIYVEDASIAQGVPKPIMEPPKVLRVWVSPWVDESETLHWPTHLFVEITPKKWSYGQMTLRDVKQLTLLPSEDPRPSAQSGKSKLTSPPTTNTPAGFSGLNLQGNVKDIVQSVTSSNR